MIILLIFHSNEIHRIRNEKEKLSHNHDSRHSYVPAPPIKRATQNSCTLYANFRLLMFFTILMWWFAGKGYLGRVQVEKTSCLRLQSGEVL